MPNVNELSNRADSTPGYSDNQGTKWQSRGRGPCDHQPWAPRPGLTALLGPAQPGLSSPWCRRWRSASGSRPSYSSRPLPVAAPRIPAPRPIACIPGQTQWRWAQSPSNQAQPQYIRHPHPHPQTVLSQTAGSQKPAFRQPETAVAKPTSLGLTKYLSTDGQTRLNF